MSNRNIGLDLIRSIAIIMVLIAHSGGIFHNDISIVGEGMRRLSICGVYGVELFFVLSGFLIGRILIKMLISEEITDRKGIWLFLRKFWVRRWLRTIPLYLLMLVANCLFLYFISGIENLKSIPLWRYFFFLQSYNPVSLGFFPESWSLSVEEWFYLIVPILLVVAYKSFNNIPLTIILVVLLVMFIRIIYVLYIGSENLAWDSEIRKNTFLRLDSLGIGLMFAYVFIKKESIFRLFFSKTLLFLGILGIVLNMFLHINSKEFINALYLKTLFFDITSISLGMVMCYVYNMKIKHSFGRTISVISKISYSVYLIHFPIVVCAANYAWGINSTLYRCVICFCAWIIIFTLSFLLYKYYEYPVMTLRDKIWINRE